MTRTINEGSQIVADVVQTRSVQLRSSFRHAAQGREIVLVLGMHRSGTSLLSNILHLLGVDMIDQPTLVSKKNKTGFWERQEFVAIQDEILATLGVPIGSPAHAVPMKPGWWRAVEIRDLKKRLRDLLAEKLAEVRRPWGFKDPRTCRLLPLWGEIFEELDVIPRFVWAVRHPAEASLSMTQKNPRARPIPVTQSEVMWLTYNYDILRYTGQHWPIIVPYDQWFEDSLSLAKDLAHELDLIWQGSDHELEAVLGGLISTAQRHHWASGDKLRCAIGLSEQFYRSILTLRRGQETQVSDALAVSMHSLLSALQPFAIEACEVKPLKEENKRLSKEVKHLSANLYESQSRVAGLHDNIQKLRETGAVVEAAERRIAELESNLEAALRERAALHEKHQMASRKLDGFRAQLASMTSLGEELKKNVSALIAERDNIQTALASGTTARHQLEKELAEALAKLADFEKKIMVAVTEKEALEEDILSARAERDSLRTELASLRGSSKDAEEAQGQAADRFAADISRLKTEAAGLRNALRSEREKLADALWAAKKSSAG